MTEQEELELKEICHGLELVLAKLSKLCRKEAIEAAAKKAATTGNRTDLQEYLKLRR
jgi:hypothetical protein